MNSNSSEPVTVFRTRNEGIISVAQSLLEGAGIPYYVKNLQIMETMGIAMFADFAIPEIQVPEAEADRARELLKDLEG